MNALKKWMIIQFTPHQTTTLPKWMFCEKCFFKSSLLVRHKSTSPKKWRRPLHSLLYQTHRRQHWTEGQWDDAVEAKTFGCRRQWLVIDRPKQGRPSTREWHWYKINNKQNEKKRFVLLYQTSLKSSKEIKVYSFLYRVQTVQSWRGTWTGESTNSTELKRDLNWWEYKQYRVEEGPELVGVDLPGGCRLKVGGALTGLHQLTWQK